MSIFSKEVAFAVGKMAIEEGLLEVQSDLKLKERIDANVWVPHYSKFRRKP